MSVLSCFLWFPGPRAGEVVSSALADASFHLAEDRRWEPRVRASGIHFCPKLSSLRNFEYSSGKAMAEQAVRYSQLFFQLRHSIIEPGKNRTHKMSCVDGLEQMNYHYIST